ncbi:MAG: hypothetical protein Q7T18_01400, partial [Sedimentisphaerales bacterium]|nr:hypothetical protein [Sedimentisphaerales bacterium]
ICNYVRYNCHKDVGYYKDCHGSRFTYTTCLAFESLAAKKGQRRQTNHHPQCVSAFAVMNLLVEWYGSPF